MACSDTGDELKFAKDFELTMLQLWSFFKNSPKCLKVYIKVAMQMKMFDYLPKNDQKRLVKIVKKTCWKWWLSLQTSVDTVYCEFPGLLQSLRVLNNEATTGGASAKGLLNKMNCQEFLSVLYMLKFMLPHLTVLGKTFQKGELNFSQIRPNIEKTKYKINQVTQQSKPLKQLKKDAANHCLLVRST